MCQAPVSDKCFLILDESTPDYRNHFQYSGLDPQEKQHSPLELRVPPHLNILSFIIHKCRTDDQRQGLREKALVLCVQ